MVADVELLRMSLSAGELAWFEPAAWDGRGGQRDGGQDELLEDFGSLVTIFAGCSHGTRSARARERLLAETAQSAEDRAE